MTPNNGVSDLQARELRAITNYTLYDQPIRLLQLLRLRVRLGFTVASRYDAQGYRILADAKGASVHLTQVDREWVDPSRTTYGIYFYSEDVEALAAEFGQRADPKPWGLREFAIGDPSGTLVRVGWPS